MMFHARFAETIARGNITEFMLVMDAQDFSNVQFAEIGNMYANQSQMDYVLLIRHIVISAELAD